MSDATKTLNQATALYLPAFFRDVLRGTAITSRVEDNSNYQKLRNELIVRLKTAKDKNPQNPLIQFYDSNFFKHLKDDPNFQQELQSLSQALSEAENQISKIENLAEEQKQKLVYNITDYFTNHAKSKNEEADEMWKYRVLQFTLMMLGIGGVEFLHPLLSALGNIFDPSTSSFGHGVASALSNSDVVGGPGADLMSADAGSGSIANGLVAPLADNTPIFGSVNNFVGGIATSDIGQGFGSIISPLAKSQLFHIGVATAFAMYGAVHQFDHWKKYSEEFKDLMQQAKQVGYKTSEIDQLKREQECEVIANSIISMIDKVTYSREIVDFLIKNKDADFIFDGIKVENKNPNSTPDSTPSSTKEDFKSILDRLRKDHSNDHTNDDEGFAKSLSEKLPTDIENLKQMFKRISIQKAIKQDQVEQNQQQALDENKFKGILNQIEHENHITKQIEADKEDLDTKLRENLGSFFHGNNNAKSTEDLKKEIGIYFKDCLVKGLEIPPLHMKPTSSTRAGAAADTTQASPMVVV